MNAKNLSISTESESKYSAANDNTFRNVFGVPHGEVINSLAKEKGFIPQHINLNPAGMVSNSVGELNYYLPET